MNNNHPGSSREEPSRVHLIFKTHLDIGFTDFAANVVDSYFNHYIPKAIALAARLRETGSPDRFIWTTGSWLIYEYLEQAGAAERRRMEAAIASGDIAWHALPFTTHSENIDPSLFRFGLELSRQLDRRFGRRTIAAKMTDVPGHTCGIIQLLVEAGVQFLHIGVNGASTPPDVPPVFVWRDPASGAELVVMYHKGTYGDVMIIPGLAEAIAFAHTGDNLGPQSIEQLQATYREMRVRFPATDIFASTMDAFAVHLPAIRPNLPVIAQEIGDTWIHGVGTDPQKVAQYRELLRWRQELLDAGTPLEDLRAFSRGLLPISEHTWGLDLKTHLGDWSNYSARDFKAAREGAHYKKMEASWQEQRGYLHSAVAALPASLQPAARNRLADLQPSRPDASAFAPLPDVSAPIDLPQFSVSFNPQTACLIRLAAKGKEWAGPQNPLGQFWYETFSAADYRRFNRQYNVNKHATRMWAIPDFTKPGIDDAAPEHKTFLPRLAWAGKRVEDSSDIFLFLLDMPEESWQEYGAPRQLSLEVRFDRREPQVRFTLQWFGKPACRLPEASWFSFLPRVSQPRAWRMDKLGQWISPYEVIRDGNRHLHALNSGVRWSGSRAALRIETLDAPLLATGRPSLLDFNNRQPNLRQGLHFNLHNNLWGTNFPMWYEDDARFRFILAIS
jgi:hypothetical protein